VIEGEFERPVSAERIGFSHGDFGLVVETLHDAARISFLDGHHAAPSAIDATRGVQQTDDVLGLDW
jgi:hypothetical protein